VLVIVVSFGYPLVVEPAFNRFTPMPDGPLRSSLLELAERDARARTRRARGRRVAADDRTQRLRVRIRRDPTHRRLRHPAAACRRRRGPQRRRPRAGARERNDVLQGTLLGALGAAAAVCLISLLISWGPLLRRAGVDAVGDPRSIALFLTVVALLGFATAPAQLLVSRRIEARADVHAL
jgi:STE24 endopeptidase